MEGQSCSSGKKEEEVVCGVCRSPCPKPVRLPACSHSFCRVCVRDLALQAGITRPFPCPRQDCGQDTIMPVDFFVPAMREEEFQLREELGPWGPVLKECKEHAEMLGGYRSRCKRHDENLKLYCFDCKRIICRDCTLYDDRPKEVAGHRPRPGHKTHGFQHIQDAAPQVREKLLRDVHPLRDEREKLIRAMDEIQTIKLNVEEQGESLALDIEDHFVEVNRIIENHKRYLLDENALRVRQKLRLLSEQERSLSILCATLQGLIDYTEECVKQAADEEVVCMQVEIQSRIEGALQDQQQKESKALVPVEEADLGVELSSVEELKQLCHSTIARLIRLASKCEVRGELDDDAEVSRTSQFSVLTRLSNGKPARQACKVECLLKSLVDDSITECQVKHIQGGEYCVQYTPIVRGRHKLTVTVNGEELAGSPYSVFVSIHPPLLGKPVTVITGIGHPQDIAIDMAGNIIMTKYIERKLSLFDKVGKRLRDVNVSRYGVRYPRFVTVDNDGCIFVGCNSNMIIKLSPEFKLMAQVTGKKNASYDGLTVVRDEVVVCDVGNKVLVRYTKDLKYAGSGGYNASSYAGCVGMSSDQDGRLYICNWSGGYIDVVCPGGDLHSFGHGVLTSPGGVCLSGRYVCVNDWAKDCVVVFTTEGEHVASFESKGLAFICADKDGFIYVFDLNNAKIIIF